MKTIVDVRRNVSPHWVGDGFPVRGLFAYHESDVFDPFLLLDYAGPHEFAPAEAPRGVGEHPHRGFETVTIVFQGELAHRDSTGATGTIGPGDVQWMTAAAGVVHEEFHSPDFARRGGTLEMAQLWVNLPASEKMAPPRYQGLLAARIPHVDLPAGAGTAHVIAGELLGTRGPAITVTPINVWDVRLQPPGVAELPVPEGHTAILVVRAGIVSVHDTTLKGVELAVLDRAGHSIGLRADEPASVLVLTGQPIGEPVVGQGPFVMNTREQIRQAIADYQGGRMGRLTVT